MSEATLLLRLAGPLQSWGGSSRFTRRHTNAEPTKSGIVGMLAAAQGRRRTDPVEDLAGLRFGVRVDQPGVLVRDFQTASRRTERAGRSTEHVMPLSERFYLSDAVFLAGVQGPAEMVEALEAALRNPRYAPVLGRRSCPPAGRLVLGVVSDPLGVALATHPWQGSRNHGGRRAPAPVHLMVVRDLEPGEGTTGAEREQDVPVSFDPTHRRFAWRWVRRELVANPDAGDASPVHDAFAEVF